MEPLGEITKYSDVEEVYGLSPASPEAYYAEIGWNLAVEKCRSILKAAATAESSVEKMILLCDTEFEALDTTLR